jgi:hypothetical protein
MSKIESLTSPNTLTPSRNTNKTSKPCNPSNDAKFYMDDTKTNSKNFNNAPINNSVQENSNVSSKPSTHFVSVTSNPL